MADTELVIKIPKELYEDIKEHGLCGHCSDREIVSEAIANGKPLPKWHGDLIDKDTLEGHYVCSIGIDEACVLKCECKDCSSGVYQLCDDIDNIPVVVKADKESEE